MGDALAISRGPESEIVSVLKGAMEIVRFESNVTRAGVGSGLMIWILNVASVAFAI